jgi:release factor glutamine methyltransferase
MQAFGDQAKHGSATQQAAVEEAVVALREASSDVERPRQEARWIAQEVLGCSGAELAAHPDRSISAKEREAIRELTARRAEGEPLQYVLGHAGFRGLRLRVTPDVLIPRPETEEVAGAAFSALEAADTRSPRVLDVGTGSGCIALALKDERAGADVHACDASADALRVARSSARRLDLDVAFFRADVLADDFTERVPGGLDVLVSNPPYVADDEAEALPASVREYEPAGALFAGDDPLRFYRVLCRQAEDLLRNGGALVVEVHADYGADIVRLCEANGLRDARLARDHTGRPRVVTARRDG